MKHLKKGIFITTLLISLIFIGCNNDDEDEDDTLGNWVKKSAFDGPARSSATSFVIGTYAYVTTGYTGDEYLKDLWAYNSSYFSDDSIRLSPVQSVQFTKSVETANRLNDPFLSSQKAPK